MTHTIDIRPSFLTDGSKVYAVTVGRGWDIDMVTENDAVDFALSLKALIEKHSSDIAITRDMS